MNLFNRFAVIIVSLALIAGAISIAALAWTIPLQSIDGLRDAVDWLARYNTDFNKGLLSAACAVVGLASFIVFFFEVLPRPNGSVKVTDLQVGDAVLSTAAIGQRVEEAVSRVPHVADARAIIKSKRKGIELSLDLHVDPDANLAEVTDEACQAARDVLTNRVHVALASPPRARLHYRELRLRSGRPVTPAPLAIPAPETPVPVEDVAPPSELLKESEGEPVAVAAGVSENGSSEEKPA